MPQNKKKRDILVFVTRQGGECAECGRDLNKGDIIFLERETGPLCLACADLGHLLYLRAGNARLTRLAKKYSRLYAVVLKWARARKRYERQGILVEAQALEKSERECFDEEEFQQRLQRREAEERLYLNEDFIRTFLEKLNQLFPKCPSGTAHTIAREACYWYCDQLGQPIFVLDDEIIFNVVQTYVRHQYTDYDELLMSGLNRFGARNAVREQVDAVLRKWGWSGSSKR